MKELVSIIMPVYNTPSPLLEKAVKSVLSQSCGEFELLVMDDGSCDETAAVCDRLCALDSRIRVRHSANGGVATARNLGLDEAQGSYITFIDSDDFVSPFYLEGLLEAAHKTGSGYVKGGAERVYREDSVLTGDAVRKEVSVVTQSAAIDDICFLRRPFPFTEVTSVWGNLYSAEAVGDTRFCTDVRIGEDFIFNIGIIRRLKDIAYLSSPLYAYYLNDRGAMCGGYSKDKVSSVAGFERYLSSLDSGFPYRYEVLNRLTNIAFVVFLMIPEGREHDEERSAVMSFIRKYRFRVLTGRKTRFKVRSALLLSYFSFDAVARLYLR